MDKNYAKPRYSTVQGNFPYVYHFLQPQYISPLLGVFLNVNVCSETKIMHLSCEKSRDLYVYSSVQYLCHVIRHGHETSRDKTGPRS